ncbi:MAG: MAPEG family protein [Sphingorhabdus sp.]
MSGNLLLPAAVLVLWTMIVLLWLSYARFSSLAKMKDQLPPAQAGIRGGDFDHLLPTSARWASHNYTHLLEQPVVFYPAVIILHLTGSNDALNIALAWSYVGIRIVHSIWQMSVNKIPVRIALFAISSLCLLALAVHAVIATLNIIE